MHLWILTKIGGNHLFPQCWELLYLQSHLVYSTLGTCRLGRDIQLTFDSIWVEAFIGS